MRIVLALIMLAVPFLAASADAPCQYAFTLWNWEKGYRDLVFFRNQIDACVDAGFNVIELGAGWPDCEPEPGRFDFSMVDERVSYVREKGLDIRLRVDVSHWPDWFEPELFQNPDGTVFIPERGYLSVFSHRNREHQLRFVSALASHFANRGFTYTPGFSVHMEVKFAAWNSYEPAAKSAFRDWLVGRYESIEDLNRTWRTGFGHFDAIDPPVPGATSGEPDLSPAVRDWILFREQALRNWVEGFAHTVRTSDASAKISVPLGESYRRESAAFANLDYWGYSRAADEVVHSYDFFWHGPGGKAQVQTAVETMTGITQLPVVLEIDGPYAIEHFGYTTDDYEDVGRLARLAGAAGIQVTNWGSTDVRTQDWMTRLRESLRNLDVDDGSVAQPEVLYYVSKWQNYAHREADEWLYGRQFGLLGALRAAGISTRVVTDENILTEPLTADALFIPYAPLIDAPVRDRLRTLSYGMRVVSHDPVGLYTTTAKTEGQFGAKIERLDNAWPAEKDALGALVQGNGESRRLRVAAAQFHTKFDVAYNTDRIVNLLCEAAERDVDVVAFTEMALTGYSKRAEFADSIDWDLIDASFQRIRESCREYGVYAILGAPTRDGDALFCSAIAIDPSGEIIDVYEKTFLAGEQWATPGRKFTMFPIRDVQCGTFICHDERYPHLVQLRALAGAQLFFYISCESGLADEHKIGPYRAQIQARAVENGVYIVHANTPARSDDWSAGDASHGQSRVVAPDGNLLAEGSMDGEELVAADIDLQHARKGGMGAALTSGPAAQWIRDGVQLIGERE
ncbi:MAG: hypothetical protein AMXMBFR82_25200 [Candidatus Hydrogenedentota bacterium]